MKLTNLVRNLERQLKAAEKLARRYDAQAKTLSDRLAAVADAVGEVMKGKTPGRKARRGKRKMSAEGRRKIAAAQKARWAKFHAKQKSKKTTKKQAQKSENPF